MSGDYIDQKKTKKQKKHTQYGSFSYVLEVGGKNGTTTKKRLDRKYTEMMIFGARKGGFQSQIRYDGMYKRSKPNETMV